jgi:opacity protein-like surface antigen
MFGFRLSVKCVTGVLLAAAIASGASAAEAQTTRRTHRESNANRQARIARAIEATYNHRFEVAGGGGFLRFNSGQYLQKNNDVTFFMTATYFLNPKLGIIGDIRGLYGNAKIQNQQGSQNFLGYNPKISAYPFMGGVAYRLYAKEQIALSVTGEAGAALGKFDGDSKGLPSSELGVWQSQTKPVFSLGANLDYNFYPNLAARFSPTYVGTLYRMSQNDPFHPGAGTIQNNWGFNMGVVYRFGKIH